MHLSNLLNLDSHFDFSTVLAPMPVATQDKIAKWVDGHVNTLVKELTDAMAASQAYSANVTAFNALKSVIARGLELGGR